MGTPTKNAHGNKEHVLKETLTHAEAKKAQGNSLFKEGKHNRAAVEYYNALNGLMCLSDQTSPQPEVTALTVALHSNLSACHQATGHYEQAAAEAQAALALHPLYTKAHFRLCKSRFSLKQFDEAAKEMAITVALTLPAELDRTMLELYMMLLARGHQQFKLPLDIESNVCVASNVELQSALLQGKSHLVLKPGNYTMEPVTVEGFFALIGVGKVEIRSGKFGHALHAKSGEVYGCNLNLVGSMEKSLVCVGGANAELNLVDCVVQDHKNVGILILKGHAILDRCSFTNIEMQAVEVRSKASVELRNCFFSKCHQGVIAHGCARQLKVIHCEIEDTTREGLLVYGERAGVGRQAARQFDDVLDLLIVSTVFKGCGYHAVSLDHGIRPLITNSVFVNNSPFAISVTVQCSPCFTK